MATIAVPRSAASWQREHENFVFLLDFLERYSSLVLGGVRSDFDLFLDAVAHLNFFSEHYHHSREEAVFACLKAKRPASAPILDRLIREHEILSSKGRKVYALLGESSGMASPEAVAHLGKYLRYFRHHIRVEDMEVLPHAIELLTETEWLTAEKAAPPGPEPFRKYSPRRHDPGFGDEAEEGYHALRGRIARLSEHPPRGLLERRRSTKPKPPAAPETTAPRPIPRPQAVQPSPSPSPRPSPQAVQPSPSPGPRPSPQAVQPPPSPSPRPGPSRALDAAFHYFNRYRQLCLLGLLILAYLQYYFLDVNLQILRLPELVFYFFNWSSGGPTHT